MKSLFISLLVLFSWSLAGAQINLVPNPSFEDSSSCPNQPNQLYKAIAWDSYGNSPDYFHSCNSFYNFALGYQTPNSGQAYAGFASTLFTPPGNKEFLGCRLSDSLKIGHKYFVSLYLSAANGSNFSLLADKQGVLFSTVRFDSLNHPPINNFSHVTNNVIITDTIGWTFFGGSFIADSNYRYLCIGNFYQNALTDTLQNSSGNSYSNSNSYYFLDDVCVSEDSLECVSFNGISSPPQTDEFIIYPNPSHGNFFVETKNENKNLQFKLFNSLGQDFSCFISRCDNGFVIYTEDLAPGVYFLNAINTHTNCSAKIVFY